MTFYLSPNIQSGEVEAKGGAGDNSHFYDSIFCFKVRTMSIVENYFKNYFELIHHVLWLRGSKLSESRLHGRQ